MLRDVKIELYMESILDIIKYDLTNVPFIYFKYSEFIEKYMECVYDIDKCFDKMIYLTKNYILIKPEDDISLFQIFFDKYVTSYTDFKRITQKYDINSWTNNQFKEWFTNLIKHREQKYEQEGKSFDSLLDLLDFE